MRFNRSILKSRLYARIEAVAFAGETSEPIGPNGPDRFAPPIIHCFLALSPLKFYAHVLRMYATITAGFD